MGDHFKLIGDTRPLPVIEMFGPTIQGEGYMAGQQTWFLRLGGCDYRCAWCDSMYAVDPAEVSKNAIKMLQKEIYAELTSLNRDYNVDTLTISGGNPAMHNLGGLVDQLKRDMWKVAVETQGSIWRDWLGHVSVLTISPKPPSAKPFPRANTTMESCVKAYTYFVGKLCEYLRNHGSPRPGTICIKVVIESQLDLDFFVLVRRASMAIESYDIPVSYYVQPVTNVDPDMSDDEAKRNILADTEMLANKVLQMKMGDVRVMPQMHVLMWGRKKGV